MLLGGGREKAPDRMFLPIRGFHDLGQGRPFGPPDQFEDLCALALGARRAGFFGRGGLGLLVGLGFLLGRCLGFAALSGFLALGRALLLGGTPSSRRPSPARRARLVRRQRGRFR
jgi:hypothetical protein